MVASWVSDQVSNDRVETSEPPGSVPPCSTNDDHEISSMFLCRQTQFSQLQSGGEGSASSLVLLLRTSEELLQEPQRHVQLEVGAQYVKAHHLGLLAWPLHPQRLLVVMCVGVMIWSHFYPHPLQLFTGWDSSQGPARAWLEERWGMAGEFPTNW